MGSRILCYSECQCVVSEVGSVQILSLNETLKVSLCLGILNQDDVTIQDDQRNKHTEEN